MLYNILFLMILLVILNKGTNFVLYNIETIRLQTIFKDNKINLGG